jgi:hypothetical protein
MEAIDELAQLADSMLQASALLADEDADTPNPKRKSTFLNVVALGNVVCAINYLVGLFQFKGFFDVPLYAIPLCIILTMNC